MSLTSISASELKPRIHVHFTTSPIEVLIRYPVILEKATEIDERVIENIFAAVDREPKLKLIDSRAGQTIDSGWNPRSTTFGQ
jgi:hypothetical protein